MRGPMASRDAKPPGMILKADFHAKVGRHLSPSSVNFSFKRENTETNDTVAEIQCIGIITVALNSV